jgi:hypothetical protein
MDKQTHYTGPGLPALLGCIFITLKLCGVINWPWIWVLAPFWIGLLLLGLILGVGLVILFITSLITRRAVRRWR